MEPRFSVAKFNDLINDTLTAVGEVVVEGEITQMNVTAKGGVNIVMKDATQAAVLSVSGYSPRIEGIRMIKEGMKVAAWGVPNLWSMGGKFSLQIYKILPLGEGALKEAYEALKRQLSAEGLFAQERKRPLPDFITKIAVLTGRDSAAQSDFIKILKENRAGFAVDYYPVQVQGKYAESEILQTMKYADAQGYDCIVLIRGGGSLEDLITFNSEKLARLIFAMQTPVVVGVGHEKDESIADYVADIRASTPSQAAYYLIANNQSFIEKQEMKADFIRETLMSRVQIKKQQLFSKYRGMGNRLLLEISKFRNRIQHLEYLLKQLPSKVTEIKVKIEALERILSSLNPLNVLERGYALVVGPAGKVINSAKQLKIGENISLNFKQGKADAAITKILD